jgi:hypothetical protein
MAAGVAREARNPWVGDDNSPPPCGPVGARLGAINQGWLASLATPWLPSRHASGVQKITSGN